MHGHCPKEMRESNKTREENVPSGKQDTTRNCYGKTLEFETEKSDEGLGQTMLNEDGTSIQGSDKQRENVGYQNQQKKWLHWQTNYNRRTEN